MIASTTALPHGHCSAPSTRRKHESPGPPAPPAGAGWGSCWATRAVGWSLRRQERYGVDLRVRRLGPQTASARSVPRRGGGLLLGPAGRPAPRATLPALAWT